jgi:transcriptional regulator with XRE-family HTH domain
MKSKKNTILLSFGNSIRKLRAEGKLTQRELAKRAGLDVTASQELSVEFGTLHSRALIA